MKTDVGLSTRFLTAQGTHRVGVIVTVAGETPPRRQRLNLALVLDRSGSMAGEKLAAAKAAAARFVSFLQRDDRLALVAFHNDVETVWGPAPADPAAALEALAHVRAEGNTNLSGGWLAGRTAVADGKLDGVNRVILFTDGLANEGITNQGALTGLARSGSDQGVGTTAIGFGDGFNELLLKGMADAGGGNFWFVERHDLMADIFSEEIEGLVSLAAQNLTVTVRALHPATAGVSFLQRYPVVRLPDGAWQVRIGDVYAVAPRLLGIHIHVNDPAALGRVQVAEAVVESDVVRAEGVEHQTITMPLVVNLDGSDHVEPTVEKELLLFEAAQARDEAARLSEEGKDDAAERTLMDAAARLEPHRGDARVDDDARDLEEHAERLRERTFNALDRKYIRSRSWAAAESKGTYLAKIQREPRRPRKPEA